MTEEQKNKCEEIINSYKEKYEKEFEEINTLDFSIDGEYTSPILRIFGFKPMGLSFFEFQFQTEASYMKWLIFLEKSHYIAGENIIDLTVSLSEVFNKNITKEEAEKLLFVKSNIEEELNHYFASKEFRNIMDIFEYRYNTAIENIGWAIANYFDKRKK